MLVNSCDVPASRVPLSALYVGKPVLRLPSVANESKSTQAFVLLVSFLFTGIALVGKNPTYTAVGNHSKKCNQYIFLKPLSNVQLPPESKKIAFETDTGFSGTVQGVLALAAKDVQV